MIDTMCRASDNKPIKIQDSAAQHGRDLAAGTKLLLQIRPLWACAVILSSDLMWNANLYKHQSRLVVSLL